MVGLIFAAQQASVSYDFLRDRFLDSPFPHQFHEQGFIGLPINSLFPVIAQYVLRGRQLRKMHVFHLAEFAQEVRKVVLLGEPGKLRGVVEPYVDDPSGARRLKKIEETPG